jgi:ABC transporter transmembrane region
MGKVIQKFYSKILIIYVYTLIAQIISLTEPYLLGRAIDGIFSKQYLFIIILFAAFLLEGFFVYKRLVFDTKVFVEIEKEIILDYLKQNTSSSCSARVARADMTHSIIGFLENDLQYFVISVINMVGSLFFIYAASPITGVVVTGGFFSVLLITWLFYSKIMQSNRISNNIAERKVDVIQSYDIGKIEDFYNRRKKVVISASTIQGKNWASLSFTRSSFLIMAIVVSTHNALGLTQGEAVMIYSYVNNFLASLFSIPIASNVISRMKDVTRRLNED